MKLADAEYVKVTCTYENEYEKEDIEDLNSDEIIKKAEEDSFGCRGDQEYVIEGWNGTHWERIDD
jgi:hypothetical protein